MESKKILFCVTLLVLFLCVSTAQAVDLSNSACMGCHSERDLRREAGPASGTLVYVPENALLGTPHEDFGCIDCHADVKKIPHSPRLAVPTCFGCHSKAQKQYLQSSHGIEAEKGNADAPGCIDCHGKHQIKRKTDSESPTNAKNVMLTCAKCHANPETSKRNHFNIANPFQDYEKSVHFKATQTGQRGATCSECHGHHLIRKSADPKSRTNKSNIPKTCSRCHEEIVKVYEQSVHGKALARGILAAPVCTDCHGEHATKSKFDPSSSVYPKNISKTTCPFCHSSAKIMAKFGVKTDRLSSYDDTYHGLALKGGNIHAANCSSCHGTHDILPSSNPESAISSRNLVKTCGKCHPQATESFANIPVHAPPGDGWSVDRIPELVQWLYLILIILTIGGMIGHNAIVLFHFVRLKYRERQKSALHTRFSTYEVANHFVLILSFLTLVITGFALKFPDAAWVKVLGWIGLNEYLRSVIHRVAGVILILQALIHVCWQLGTTRGRQEVVALLPWFTDVSDVLQNMLYHLGFTDKHPHFGRYTYIEKSEFWAMAWGTFIMALTGLTLWFPALAMIYLPPWAFKVAEVIHYYEAWLAALAILVWHMFFVWFHPTEYPMSITWIDGKITEDELRQHRPKEYAEMQANRQEEDTNLETEI